MSMRTGRLSELSAEHEVRYTGNGSFLVITKSKTSGITDGLNGLVVSEPGPKIRRSSLLHKHVRVSPSGVQPRFPIHVFSVEVSLHQDRHSPTQSGHVRSD